LEPEQSATPAPTNTHVIPTHTATNVPPQSTSTPTPALYTIDFHSIWDKNADTRPQDNEENIKDITIKINDLSCHTDEHGRCQISIHEGTHGLIIDTSSSSIPDLNYLFLDKDILEPKTGFDITVKADMDILIPLAQGPLPLPIKANSTSGIVNDYGGINDKGEPHYAIDFRIIGDNPQIIYANISGIIDTYPGSTPENPFGDCNQVGIVHRDSFPGNFNVIFGHLTKVYVKPGEKVEVGQPIGEIDPAIYSKNVIGYTNDIPDYGGMNSAGCTNNPHLEYGVFGPGGKGFDSDWGFLNPYDFLTVKGLFGNPQSLPFSNYEK
jgi:hypothetical protein